MASKRSLILLAALGLTLVATWYAAGLEDPADDDQSVELAVPERRATGGVVAVSRPGGAVDTPAATAAPSASGPGTPVPMAAVKRMTAATSNLFVSRSWQPPPPPPEPLPAPVAQEPAQAPPLPFKYLGRLEEDGQVAVFLAEGNQHPRLVRKGDQWPNYRVDNITSEGMQLTYLPLKQTQSLQFGNSN